MYWFHEGLPLVLAQQTSGQRSWIDAVSGMGAAQLAIILIFGTGLVSAIGYAVAATIRAYNAAPDESEEISEWLDGLEKRVAALEKQQ